MQNTESQTDYIDQPVATNRGLIAISPVAVFLALYVAVSVISGDFYRMPIAVALAAASIWSVIIYRGHSLQERIDTFSRAAGSPNIMYMIWVFILAGAFASLAKETGSVDATVTLTLQWLPPQMVVPGLFVAACFISLSIGTSVGTVVALTPLAAELANSGAAPLPFMTAVVIGGAFFGDNLSFISDTTIAATRTQGCNMNDKFRANLWIVLPAAIATMTLYTCLGQAADPIVTGHEINPWLVLPYLIIIATALMGINVTIVLSLGIVSSLMLAMAGGADIMTLCGYMGTGIGSMGDLIVITLLAAGMLGIIKAAGGISFILQCLTSRISSVPGAKASIVGLVGLVNLCTANNTVAIITVGSLARSIASRFGIPPRRTASLLDTGSCIVQCIIPYGAQTLLASSLAGISPVAPFPYLYYPWALALSVSVAMFIPWKRGGKAPRQ
ncbi:MAG: Na+/H+ antiporter NhaC family protein [Muribaculaceae bacterium]|nr:Na+/H+ antiporter NhaC family protein [Muribaculaceae bacterium]